MTPEATESETDTMLTLPILGELTYREWHGFVNGLYCGVVEGGRSGQHEGQKEYWRGGYMLGALGRYLAAVGLLGGAAAQMV